MIGTLSCFPKQKLRKFF